MYRVSVGTGCGYMYSRRYQELTTAVVETGNTVFMWEWAFLLVPGALQTPAVVGFRREPLSGHVDLLVPPVSERRRDRLGVLRKGALCGGLAQRVVDHVSAPDFAWTTDRHQLYPTTDCEVHSIPWLEEEMASVLHQRLLPALASLFAVDVDCLLLRDQFVVKYSSEAGMQRGLESHYDESCFSYVMQLNEPSSFVGGGTLFEHAPCAISVPQGDTLLFCGYRRHTGVELTNGTRYILTGFVDYRADVDDVRTFYEPLSGELPRPYGAGSNDFPSPHLTVNMDRLSAAYGGLRGDALLHSIAYSPPKLQHVDMTQLRSRCANWLEHWMVPNERFYMFLQATVGQDASDADGGDEPGVR